MDEWDLLAQRLNAQRQQQAAAAAKTQAENDAVAAALQKRAGGIGGVLAGIGEKINDFGQTMGNIGKTIFGGISQGSSEAKTKQIRQDASDRRNEIARKYGYNSYAEAQNDENIGQAFWDEIRNANQQTSSALSEKRQSEDNSFGNVKNIDLNTAKGQALNTIGTVFDVAPGFKLAGNIISGGIEGAGDAYKAAAGGTDADVWGNGNLGMTLGRIGAGTAGAFVGGKVGSKLGPGKTVLGQMGKSAISGAASGATSGGIMGLASGQDVFQSALQGAKSGAEGGAFMGGINAIGAKGIDAIRNRKANKALANQAESNLNDQIIDETAKKYTSKLNTTGEEGDTYEQTTTTKTRSVLSPEREAELDYKYRVAKQNQGEALMKEYGTIDAPTARSVGDARAVLTDLYDNYGLKNPAEVQYAAKKLTGDNGAITKMTRKLAASAGDIDYVYDNNSLDRLIGESGLGDPNDTKATAARALKNQINNIIKSTHSNDGRKANANDVLDMVKKLERKSADVMGKSGNNYHRATSDDVARASVLNAVASDYKDRIWNNAKDISTVLTPEAIKELKSVFPKNKEYQKAVDTIIATAKNGQELRHTMAPLVNGSKIANNSRMIADTAGAQLVKAATSSNPVVAVGQIGATKLLESQTANKIRANRYAKQAAKAQAELTGEPVKTSSNVNKLVDAAKDKISNINAVEPTGKFAKYVAGQGDIESPVGKGILGKAANAAMEAGERATILDAVNPNATATIAAFNDWLTKPRGGSSAINTLGNIENRLVNRATTEEIATQPQFAAAQNNLTQATNDLNTANAALQQAQAATATAQQTNGAQQLDRIRNAMELALSAGDITAYGQLADLYTQAAKMYGATTTANATSNLSSSQIENLNKLDTAGNAIDELEALFQKAGGGQGLIGGNAANFMASLGLNSDVATYNSISRGLINQIGAAIGKTDSLNTEGEVNRALELIPKFTDDAQTAQNKLEQLRQMLATNKQTVYQNYGLTQ